MRKYETELRALMLAGLDGEAGAYTQLLQELSTHLRGYFRRKLVQIGRSPAEAEDLLQETLIAMHTRRHTYDRSQLFTPWAQAIARYRLLDYLRRSRSAVKETSVEEAEEVWAADDTLPTDSTLDLETLLTQVTPKTGQAIRLVRVEGLSVEEAAARTGMSASAVKVSIHRGIKALSRLVSQRSKS